MGKKITVAKNTLKIAVPTLFISRFFKYIIYTNLAESNCICLLNCKYCIKLTKTFFKQGFP